MSQAEWNSGTNTTAILALPDGPQVALPRTVDGVAGVVADHRVPPGPVDAVVRERLDRLDHAADGRGRQGNVVGVAAHETTGSPFSLTTSSVRYLRREACWL